MASTAVRNWESTFEQWSQPLGKVEEEKSENAIRGVKKAIAASEALTDRNVRTFVQGSYCNRTGVRQESDVDVCVLYDATFFHNDIPAPDSRQSLGFQDAAYGYDQYRNDVHNALVSFFGGANVTPGNKAFEVHENTYRVDADVVACVGYRHYFRDGYGQLRLEPGTALRTRDGNQLITNFPDQQYANGVGKNQLTHERFKPMVRIIKKLSCEMADRGIAAAAPMKSFLLESIVWNQPDVAFYAANFRERVDLMLQSCWTGLQQHSGGSWYEENGIKKLLGGHQKCTSDQLKAFVQAAWDYTR